LAATTAFDYALDLAEIDALAAELPHEDEHAIEIFAPAEIVIGAPGATFTARAFAGAPVRGIAIVLGGDALDLASVAEVRAWNGPSQTRCTAGQRVGSRIWVRLPELEIAPGDSVAPPLFDRGVASLADYRRAIRARARRELSFELRLEAEDVGTADLVVTLHALDGTPLDATPAFVPVRTAGRRGRAE